MRADLSGWWHYTLGSPDRRYSTWVLAVNLECARFNAAATFRCQPEQVRVLSAMYRA